MDTRCTGLCVILLDSNCNQESRLWGDFVLAEQCKLSENPCHESIGTNNIGSMYWMFMNTIPFEKHREFLSRVKSYPRFCASKGLHITWWNLMSCGAKAKRRK